MEQETNSESRNSPEKVFCEFNPIILKKTPAKEFIFSKVAGLQPAALQKVKFFTGIFEIF